MSQELYTILSLAARYFFVFMLLIILIRAYIWLRKDNNTLKQFKKSLLSAGVVGEARIIIANSNNSIGDVLPVYREGIIGSSKNCDLRLNSEHIRKRQIYYRLDEGLGLYTEPLHNGDISINAFNIDKNTRNAYIINGSVLKIADIAVQIFFYPGFSVPTLSPSEMQAVVENVRHMYLSQLKPLNITEQDDGQNLENDDINKDSESE